MNAKGIAATRFHVHKGAHLHARIEGRDRLVSAADPVSKIPSRLTAPGVSLMDERTLARLQCAVSLAADLGGAS